MPTVLRFRNYDVRIYPHDHPPAHVHMVGPGWVVVLDLAAMTIREIDGNATLREARRAVREMIVHREFLLTEWSRIHG
jgi:Domain of unknown function (DUF4160)